MVNVQIVPAHKFRGRQCFTFVQKRHRDAFKELTGKVAASEEKIKALAVFGVEARVLGEDSNSLPTPANAVQESNG